MLTFTNNTILDWKRICRVRLLGIHHRSADLMRLPTRYFATDRDLSLEEPKLVPTGTSSGSRVLRVRALQWRVDICGKPPPCRKRIGNDYTGGSRCSMAIAPLCVVVRSGGKLFVEESHGWYLEMVTGYIPWDLGLPGQGGLAAS